MAEAPTAAGWSGGTFSLCPTFLRPVSSRIFEEQGQIWMDRTCSKHGAAQALLASDSAEYLRLRQYVPDRSGGCCGEGETCSPTGPPVCVLLLEITRACNLRCPTCYADAGGHARISTEEACRRPRASFRPQVHERLYGQNLCEEKQTALQRAQEAGIIVTLVPTVERGVNEDEIGDMFYFALSLDNINGITYQPVMDTGRYLNDYQSGERLTLTDTLRKLEEQTGGMLRSSDFVGLPCSHPDCCALTYGFLDAARTTITPLTRHLDVGRYLALFSDRISFSGML